MRDDNLDDQVDFGAGGGVVDLVGVGVDLEILGIRRHHILGRDTRPHKDRLGSRVGNLDSGPVRWGVLPRDTWPEIGEIESQR
jgi:hypothetical protein